MKKIKNLSVKQIVIAYLAIACMFAAVGVPVFAYDKSAVPHWIGLYLCFFSAVFAGVALAGLILNILSSKQ